MEQKYKCTHISESYEIYPIAAEIGTSQGKELPSSL